MKIVIVGGSAAGNFAALLLARAGHEVLVVEQDALSHAPDVESAAASAFRGNAPQIVQPHIAMGRCRYLLVERLPDVYRALLAAGVVDAPLATQMPASLADKSPRAGDEYMAVLMSRRSTIDWVLQRAVLDEPGVAVRYGVRIVGLLADSIGTPHVTGVRTADGELRADVVVDATGRRSPIDDWVSQLGARPSATRWAECGIAYYSRHYRWRSLDDLPGPPTTRIVAALDEFTVGIWGADNGSMQLAVAPMTKDRRFKGVRRPDVFTAALRTVPTLAAWVDAMNPITEVFPMAGLHNTLRRLVVDGAPVVTGMHAVGDSVSTTNPTFGRGLSFALQGALDLVHVIEKHDDPVARSIALDDLVADHIVPFYEDQAAIDFGRLAMLRHTILDEPPPNPPRPSPDKVTFAQLRMAALVDPTAFRGLWRIMAMTCRPDEVYTDPDVVASTQEVLRNQEALPTVAQPTREQLVNALGSSLSEAP